MVGHMCKPSRLAGMRAHFAPPKTVVTCPPPCGKQWQVTQTHYGKRPHEICGCGWAAIDV
jgi:hypothetical protein